MYCIPQCTFMLFHEAFLSSFGKIISAQQSIHKYLYHLAKTETIVTYVFISFYVIQNTYCLAYHLYLTLFLLQMELMLDDKINHRFLLLKWYSSVHYPIHASIKKESTAVSQWRITELVTQVPTWVCRNHQALHHNSS